ncbi:MAG: ATPase, T2SS/T4P/T4SS family [Patescibacteria group bacterium]|jgi:type II secretory ATPase GspE/PulE/Tfp pilus assembly ATPase PilB-like protein
MSQKIITKIFNYAAGEGADNLVIARRADQLVLDCYFSGRDKQSLILPKKLDPELFSSLRKILAIAPGELTVKKYCKLHHKSGCINFYLTILPEANGEKIIINLIDRPFTLWRLNRIGLQKPGLQEIRKSLKLKSGLVIISSPEGEGKSATLNSLLLELGDSNKSIYSLQKQTAYEIPGVASLLPTKTNWEKLLKLDSEIIFTDDLDEPDSLEYAIRAANSGRLVFGTMTAADSFETLHNIVAAKLPLKLKLDNLKMIVNQRLAAMKRKSGKASRDQRKEIGLFEVLQITPTLKKLLIEKHEQKPESYCEELEKTALKDGFCPLAHDRTKKTKEGLI